MFFPYAKRFINNAKKLNNLKIPTISPLALYCLPHLQRTAVHYKPVLGSTLRELSKTPADLRPLFEKFGEFLAELHQKGVYFRSIHLGNVVLQDAGDFALIDIADLKIFSKPLSEHRRKRNMRHLLRPEQDNSILKKNLEFLSKSYAKRRAAFVDKRQ